MLALETAESPGNASWGTATLGPYAGPAATAGGTAPDHTPGANPPLGMSEETPHELVISGPGGLTREETLNAAAQLFPLTRAGQHVYFDVPETRGTAPVYAFASSQGLKVLDINHVGSRLRVKCVDTP